MQAVLKKVATLPVNMICPLHGPILKEELEFYVQKYNEWSQYQPEEEGILIACASLHSYTLQACQLLEKDLKEQSKKVELIDLTKEDITRAVGEAFHYNTLVLASSTYNAELVPCMDEFIRLLKAKGLQNRKIAYIENGTWAPMAGKWMKEGIMQMKNMESIEPVVTVRTKVKEEVAEKIRELSERI